MPETPEITLQAPAKQSHAITVRPITIVDEIDDPETLQKFRQSNPRYTQERNRILNLTKTHILVIEGSELSRITGILRRIEKKNPGLKYKAIRSGNGQIFVGHDIKANGQS